MTRTAAPRAARFDRLLGVLFVLALVAPAIDRTLRPAVKDSVSAEFRKPAPMPRLAADVAAIQSFPVEFDAHVRDTLGLRDRFLRWHNALALLAFGVAPAPLFVVGEGRWLFFSGDSSVEVYRGRAPLGPAGIAPYRAELERRREFLRGLGIDYVFTLAPNKETIYPERMPPELNRCGPTRYEEVLAEGSVPAAATMLDLRAALLAEKAHDTDGDHLYFPDGTHWTDRGAWAALGPIVAHLAREYPAVAYVPREGYTRAKLEAPAIDTFALQLYLADVLVRDEYAFRPAAPARARLVPGSDPDWSAVIRETVVDDPRLPRVLLIHDSFGPWLRTLLAEQCSELTCVASIPFPKSDILEARPDIVIELRTERFFATPLPEWVGEMMPLSAEAFDALEAAAPGADAATGLAAVAPFLSTTITPAGEGDLAIEVAAHSGRILLPDFGASADRLPALRIDLTSPADTTLCLWYRLAADATYRQRQVFRVPIRAGRNDVRILLPLAGIVGPLLCAPGEAEGRYLLHAVDARRAPR